MAAFLFADYFQLHTGLVFCQACLLIWITAPHLRGRQVLCFLFPACHGLDAWPNTIINYWETEMKKWRTQNANPFSGFTEQTWTTPPNCYQNFWNLTLNFLLVYLWVSAGWPKSTDSRCLALVLMSRARGGSTGKPTASEGIPDSSPALDLRRDGEMAALKPAGRSGQTWGAEPRVTGPPEQSSTWFNLGRWGCVPPI